MREFIATLWGLPMALLFGGVGLILSLRCGFVQLRRLPEVLRCTLGGLFKSRGSRAEGAVTPLQALCAALAGTVGTGNIAGVALAVCLGGPGALFWLWASALLGMGTKYTEVALALRFRERGPGGEWLGGPMYSIKNGLGPRWMPLARAFALAGTLAALCMGGAVQGCEISGAARMLSMELLPGLAAERPLFRLCAGLAVAACGYAVLRGGMARLGRVCEALVPAMGLAYVLGCLAVICAHASALPGVFSGILSGALEPRSFAGALGWGLRRGLFSNEAGLGSAPIAHASSSETEPARQGFYGIFEVFCDTLVICTLTGLAILCSGAAIPYGTAATLSLPVSAFATVFGGGAAAAILALCLLLFSLSSLLSWGMYGLRCCAFLLGRRPAGAYLALYCLAALPGALAPRALVWELADLANALMALPNLVSLLLLSGEAARITRRYFAQRQSE